MALLVVGCARPALIPRNPRLHVPLPLSAIRPHSTEAVEGSNRSSCSQEVRSACGLLDILNQHRSVDVEVEEVEEEMVGDAPAADAAAAASARRRQEGKGQETTPCTRPRALELYCGRAGLSASFAAVGCDVWFMDWNIEAVRACSQHPTVLS